MKEILVEFFEIHITSDEKIHTAAAKLGIKTITVDLYTPEGTVLRSEHMTSFVIDAENYEACKEKVDKIVKTLEESCTLVRVKIECPFYKHYQKASLYMESHFVTEGNYYPVSRNRKKTASLGTERTYNKDNYEKFAKKWQKEQIELCLYDTNVKEDSDWFDLYAENNFAFDMAMANFAEEQ